jgi:hypothetical protein
MCVCAEPDAGRHLVKQSRIPSAHDHIVDLERGFQPRDDVQDVPAPLLLSATL